MKKSALRVSAIALVLLLTFGYWIKSVFFLSAPNIGVSDGCRGPSNTENMPLALPPIASYDANDLTQFEVREVIQDFLHIVFARDSNLVPQVQESDRLKNDAAQLIAPVNTDYEYWVRPDGAPERRKLTKWTVPIRLGLCRKEASSCPPLAPNVDLATYEQVKVLRHDIQRLTGIPVKIIKDAWTTGTTNEYVTKNVAILKTSSFAFKRPDTRCHLSSGGDIDFWHDGIAFTPGLLDQVQGSIYPAFDGSIGRAGCNIWEHHTEKMKQALTAECLFRSLGFPNQSRLTKNALVGNWNSQYPHRHILNQHHPVPPRSRIPSSDEHVITTLTRYDRLLIEILYDKRLKPGMSKEEVGTLLPKIITEKLMIERK